MSGTRVKKTTHLLKTLVAVLFSGALMLVCIGCSSDGANDTAGGADPSKTERVLKEPDWPYDPTSEMYYYDYDPDSDSDSWSSSEVYLHEVTKTALEKLVRNHLESAQDNIDLQPIYKEIGADYYDEEQSEQDLLKYHEQVDLLVPLLERIESIDAEDQASLDAAYREFHEVLLVPEAGQ